MRTMIVVLMIVGLVGGCGGTVDISSLPAQWQPPTCGIGILDSDGWIISDASGLGGHREDCGRATFICDNWCWFSTCDSDCDGWSDSDEAEAGSDRCDPDDTPDGPGVSVVCSIIVADMLESLGL